MEAATTPSEAAGPAKGKDQREPDVDETTRREAGADTGADIVGVAADDTLNVKAPDAPADDDNEEEDEDESSSSSSEEASVLGQEEEAKLFRVEESQLQEYLTQMRIDSLFEELVEEMLVDTPDNPVKYMIDYLFAQFPDQARESSFANTFPTAANLVGGGIPLTGISALSMSPKEDELEGSDDEEEVAGRAPDLVNKGVKRNAEAAARRRGAVCTPAPSDLALLQNVVMDATQTTTKEDLQILMDALEKDYYFSHLDAGQRGALVKGFSIRSFAQDAAVCRQGETCGQFFVVASGECRQEMHDERILTLKPATCFGHANLLHATKAITTVVVTSETARIFSIAAEHAKALLQTFQQTERVEAHCTLLRKLPIFGPSVLSDVEVMRLAVDVASIAHFEAGEIMVRQHAPSDTMFVLISGTARCEQRLSPADSGQLITRFDAGNWFGEISLITDRPRAASVVAETAISSLAISRDRFVRVFGPLTEVLGRDEELFRRFVSDKL